MTFNFDRVVTMMCVNDVIGMVRERGDGGEKREGVRVLHGALPGRLVHHTYAPTQPVLRRQPHRALSSHLRCLFSRVLPAD